ncbi:unnamed protein product [Penicillium nalgiovense]|nr:unnamed protein product [Penicillium nalgiovense]
MDQIINLLTDEEVTDVDEESFLLFAQDIPSNNLGMLNPRAPSVEISINGNEYTVHQSPSLLSSHRVGGTTGAGKYEVRTLVHRARMICTSSFMICPRNPQRYKPKHGHLRRSFTRVRSAQTRPEGRGVESSYPLFCLCLGSRGECLIVSFDSDPITVTLCFSPPTRVLWKITPLFAEWITNPANPLWTNAILSQTSTVAELGTGISALVALALAPSVRHYIATDQEYVRKLFRANLDANASVSVSSSNSKAKGKSKGSKSSKSKPSSTARSVDNISFTTLDWETDQAASLKECMDPDEAHGQDGEEEGEEDKGFDLLLSCDCIYNEALVAPFVRTCAEICRLRPVYVAGSEESRSRRRPTVCIIAQQQRSPDVFETWLRETMREFRVWRLRDDVLGEGLKSGSGYLVHLLLVK